MTDKRRLVFSIIQFCQKELQADDLSDDAKESLEVTKENVIMKKYKVNLPCRRSPVSVYNLLTLLPPRTNIWK